MGRLQPQYTTVPNRLGDRRSAVHLGGDPEGACCQGLEA